MRGARGAAARALSTAAAAALAIPSAAHSRVAFVGAPFSYGQSHRGVEDAPRALRAALPRAVAALGWGWVDEGDFGGDAAAVAAAAAADPADAADPTAARHAAGVGAACGAIYSACLGAARRGDFVLCAGGDHSVAAGSVAAALAARPRAGVVWVDAHADINTPATSPSGNLHGMPVALLLKRAALRGGAWEWLARAPRLEPGALAYVGLRDLDAAEAALVRALGIAAFTMADIDRRGIARVADDVARALKGRPLHVSLDIDAVDPGAAGATGTAVPGGLSLRETHFLLETLAATKRLCSMDVVEINPRLGGGPAGADGATAAGAATVAAGAAFVTSALGKTTLAPKK